MLYNNHRRPVLRAEHPGKQDLNKIMILTWAYVCVKLDLQLTDLSKLIGDEWKKLSETQKAVSRHHFTLLDKLLRPKATVISIAIDYGVPI